MKIASAEIRWIDRPLIKGRFSFSLWRPATLSPAGLRDRLPSAASKCILFYGVLRILQWLIFHGNIMKELDADEPGWREEATMNAYPESHKDLLQADVAVLATRGKNGYPQVTALWFLLDDDGMVKLSLNTARQKTKNLQEHPECTLFILDRKNPQRTLEIRARAEISSDKDYKFADKLGKKYGANLRNMDRPGEARVLVVLHPVKVNAIDLSKR